MLCMFIYVLCIAMRALYRTLAKVYIELNLNLNLTLLPFPGSVTISGKHCIYFGLANASHALDVSYSKYELEGNFKTDIDVL